MVDVEVLRRSSTTKVSTEMAKMRAKTTTTNVERPEEQIRPRGKFSMSGDLAE